MAKQQLVSVHGFTESEVAKLESATGQKATAVVGAGLGGLAGVLSLLSTLGTFAPQVVALIQQILAEVKPATPAPAPASPSVSPAS